MAIFIYGIIFSSMSDYLLSRGDYVTKPRLRRVMAIISLGLPGITVAVLGYTTRSWILCMAVLSIGIGFRSAIYMGHIGAVYDIAPTYSGTVYGFVSMIGNISGFVTPLVTAAFTKENPDDIMGWRHTFWLCAAFYFATACAFGFVNQSPAEFEVENTNIYESVRNYGSNENVSAE